MVAFATWPQETVLRCTLSDLAEETKAAGVTRTAVIVVGDVLAAEGFSDSYLYSSGRARRGAALMRVLLLGGTAEARALAARLHPDVDVISSLAGRVPEPALPVGEVRIGGFGGVDGHAALAVRGRVSTPLSTPPIPTPPPSPPTPQPRATSCELPHLVLARPAWDPGDAIVVGSDVEAAKTVAAERYSRVFLTTGRSGTAAFAGVDAWFLIRAVTAPDAGTLPRHYQLCCRAGRTTTTTSWRCCATTTSTLW